MILKKKIGRRDFLNGMALGVAAGMGLTPRDISASLATNAGVPSGYPPCLMGMRGSHSGSYEVAHALAWNGAKFPVPSQPDESVYDLIVVGGGLSGLAAAYYFRQQRGEEVKILILDNHDDFGGHAKRNEFNVDGQNLIGYGGSQSIDGPGKYSKVSAGLLKDLGIFTDRFYDYYDTSFQKQHKLKRGVFFDKEHYGKDQVLPSLAYADKPELAAKSYPLSHGAREKLLSVMAEKVDYLKGMNRQEKIRFLRQTSYKDYLTATVGLPEEAYTLFADSTRGFWGLGWDAVSALEACRFEMLATENLNLGNFENDNEREEPYIFHFPDGNAAIARLLVRKLISTAIAGSTMEDIVRAEVNYDTLDARDEAVRLRLNSTAINVQHTVDEKHVDVDYVTAGQTRRSRADHVVLACYNHMIPHICPEIGEAQVEALSYAAKVPLTYLSIAVRNWRALAETGMSYIEWPHAPVMHSFGLDFPVSMGGYKFANNPNQPTVLHGTYVPITPGLSSREQHKRGRQTLYETSWDRFESTTVDFLQRSLESGGFDAERDIAGITVNRWPHGYAYEYNELWDPEDWGPEKGPHIEGRQQLGRISIANSDSSAYAYVDGAIDAAHRAVMEQMST